MGLPTVRSWATALRKEEGPGEQPGPELCSQAGPLVPSLPQPSRRLCEPAAGKGRRASCGVGLLCWRGLQGGTAVLAGSPRHGAQRLLCADFRSHGKTQAAPGPGAAGDKPAPWSTCVSCFGAFVPSVMQERWWLSERSLGHRGHASGTKESSPNTESP
ncbi:hypothetical protein H1C71_035010 [Ictidomys tridecemlineatus]|nr:hypothetical protein H1C71_035010 [Ictidomys tridecemlineatus]KAG3267508.1 hypothetical protein H1C71_035010 [Ictidomys tridecemlineatus]